jgi:uncharacterized protein YdeI (BOF family)
MLRKTKTIIIALIITISFLAAVSQHAGCASTNSPASLKIYLGPTSVPADNGSYNCIFVQLLDASGKPARASQDITVGLSSSETNIGTVQPSITIPKDETYAQTSFQTTFSPGTTTIAASATGFATVTSTMTTVAPIPAQVAVYGFPSTLPADGKTYNAILVQLQDSSGNPAKAPKGGVQVTLSCSDTSVGSVTPSVTIPEGVTYVTANFTTVAGTTKTLSASVGGIAQDYTSVPLTVTTTPVGSNPNQIKIFTGPSEIPADNNKYSIVALELQNSTGFVCELPSATTVALSSSKQTVAQIGSQVTILSERAYTVATLTTTYEPGTTTITAMTNGTSLATQSLTTTGFTPSRLAVFCVPSILPSDNATYSAIQVQLQDANGDPAKNPTSDVTVDLFSSEPTVATVSPTLTIPFGQTEATGTITVTNSPGTTQITAQASSYQNGQASMTTYVIDFMPLQITLTPDSSTLNNGAQTNITTYVANNGVPVSGVTLQFTSDSGGSFTTTTDKGNGYYTTTFTAASFTKTTTCTITVTAAKTGYASNQATAQITVGPSGSTSSTTNSTQTSNANVNAPVTIQFCIKDGSGNPLSSVSVNSTAQPAGTDPLSAATNSTGYVVFKDAPAGNYTFKIIKSGYYQLYEPIKTKGLPIALTLTLTSDGASSKGGGGFPTTIVIIVVAVVVVVIVVILLLKRAASSETEPQLSNF